ncbi:hypothetical protein BJ508DRAFT_329109 [Ascobolus immersus RN42]|uniref:Uncharacterized protein n=1 Tax=Ascobolus immersus RN42 TaxID=1160509 RepID=A0A3N4HY44_ASCIM|nr:hypothetical protein BJ508DRAFT_329109 [Ascobolus immersus RN42]
MPFIIPVVRMLEAMAAANAGATALAATGAGIAGAAIPCAATVTLGPFALVAIVAGATAVGLVAGVITTLGPTEDRNGSTPERQHGSECQEKANGGLPIDYEPLD